MSGLDPSVDPLRPHAPRSEAVDGRRLVVAAAEASQIANAKVVGEDEQHIGTVRREGRQRCEQRGGEEGEHGEVAFHRAFSFESKWNVPTWLPSIGRKPCSIFFQQEPAALVLVGGVNDALHQRGAGLHRNQRGGENAERKKCCELIHGCWIHPRLNRAVTRTVHVRAPYGRGTDQQRLRTRTARPGPVPQNRPHQQNLAWSPSPNRDQQRAAIPAKTPAGVHAQ